MLTEDMEAPSITVIDYSHADEMTFGPFSVGQYVTGSESGCSGTIVRVERDRVWLGRRLLETWNRLDYCIGWRSAWRATKFYSTGRIFIDTEGDQDG